MTGASSDWKETSAAARFLGISSRMVLNLIRRRSIQAKPKNPESRRPTFLVFWPDVLDYERSRIRARGKSATQSE